MKVTIQNGTLSGEITAAPSKSAMQRACALALLANGKSIIRNAGYSNDDKAALGVIQSLGARLRSTGENEIEINSNGIQNAGNNIDCGESGLGIRMFTPLAALSEKKIRITGSGSLLSRPMDFFDEILPQLSISVQSNNGKLPIEIQGPLKPVDITVDGSLSSQFLTGLVFAYAAAEKKNCTIKVNNLKSRPYIDLSLQMLSMAGIDVENENYEYFHFKESRNEIQPFDYTVEGDWSGAAFLLVGGAISGNIIVKSLNLQSAQADKAILQTLEKAGADMQFSDKGIEIKTSELKAFNTDATDCPDLFPPLAALAVYCKGVSKIKGVSRLEHKESHRGLTIQEELGKLGIDVKLQGDDMIIEGGKPVQQAVLSSHNDHRIAMMAAIIAIGGKGDISIENAEAINKSYPAFYDHLRNLGVFVSIDQQ